MSAQYYDIVGDIHGHADALRRLLIKTGYSEMQGAFRHAQRKMVFVGDFIYRGPEQRQVLRMGRAMCQAGRATAVVGNHEVNRMWRAASTGKAGCLRTPSV